MFLGAEAENHDALFTKITSSSPPPPRLAPPRLRKGDDKFIFMGKAAWSSGINVEQALQVHPIVRWRLGDYSACSGVRNLG